jgi:hypothetical protein
MGISVASADDLTVTVRREGASRAPGLRLSRPSRADYSPIVASVRAVLSLAALATAMGGCAAIEGLTQYDKQDCSQGCDDGGGLDATAPGHDGGAPPDGGPGGADADAASVGADASDGGSSGVESGGGDAGGGCGPLNVVENCGACGVQCSKTTGTPSCTGATCTYVCTAGHSDCNTAPPDTDGCECATPGCCGSSCQTSHSDGVGQSYFDCNPPKTYSETSAFSACTAYAQSVGSTAAACIGPLTCTGSSTPTICFSNGAGKCASYCWQYTDVYADGGPGTVWDCTCPAHVVGGWN